MIFAARRRRRHDEAHRQLEVDEREMTPGAKRRIRSLEERWRLLVRSVMIAGALFALGFVLTGWQIARAFDEQQAERLSRIGAQSSINAYVCRQIDAVGNGVAALVAVSLANAPPREEIPASQLKGYDRFRDYLEQQRRPPRCGELALKLAVLTGADPEDVELVPLRLHREGEKEGSVRRRRDTSEP